MSLDASEGQCASLGVLELPFITPFLIENVTAFSFGADHLAHSKGVWTVQRPLHFYVVIVIEYEHETAITSRPFTRC